MYLLVTQSYLGFQKIVIFQCEGSKLKSPEYYCIQGFYNVLNQLEFSSNLTNFTSFMFTKEVTIMTSVKTRLTFYNITIT